MHRLADRALTVLTWQVLGDGDKELQAHQRSRKVCLPPSFLPPSPHLSLPLFLSLSLSLTHTHTHANTHSSTQTHT